MEQLGIDSYVTIDSALQNEVFDHSLDQYNNLTEILHLIKNKNVVGLTITDLRWHPLYGKNLIIRDKIKKSISLFAEYLLKKEYAILLIPQIFGNDSYLEKPLLNEILKTNNNNVILLPENIDSYAQQVIISKLFCVVGMRYHPNIFAAKGCTPSIAICYEHKATAFMEKLGRSDLSIDVKNISSNILIQKFEYLKENYDKIRTEIEHNIPKLIDLSKKTTKILKEKLKEFQLI